MPSSYPLSHREALAQDEIRVAGGQTTDSLFVESLDARVVDFRTALLILLDGQFLPLTAQVQRPQNVIEERMRAQLSRGAASALAQMRPDKFLELRKTQIRWNPLP